MPNWQGKVAGIEVEERIDGTADNPLILVAPVSNSNVSSIYCRSVDPGPTESGYAAFSAYELLRIDHSVCGDYSAGVLTHSGTKIRSLAAIDLH